MPARCAAAGMVMMHRRALTFLELLLAIALLALLIGIALPNLAPDLRQRSLTESADRLRALIVMCRAKAMQEGLVYRVSFPGTPDPNDPFADKEVEIPGETLQPIIERQIDPLKNPESFGGFDATWKDISILQPGTRCVAVFPDRPSFEIRPESPVAGPSITEGTAPFVHLYMNPDGTTNWVTFVLTDLPYETQIQSYHVGRIFNVIVDGRTGQTWVQRALRTEEVELMQELHVQPLLHIDFTSSQEITEENIRNEIVDRQGRAMARLRKD